MPACAELVEVRRFKVSSFNACGVQKFKNSMIVAAQCVAPIAMRCADSWHPNPLTNYLQTSRQFIFS